MKHLFIIHSHTVFLTSIGVIEKLKLRDEDVIFLYARHYKNDLGYPYKVYDFTEIIENSFHIFFSYTHRQFLLNKKQRNKIVNFIDNFVKNEVSDNYCLYTPHLQCPAHQILATNDKCIKCFFVQEGARIMKDLATDHNLWYFVLYNKLVLRNEKRMWKCYNWFPDKYAPYQRGISAFAFDKQYFCNYAAETIMVQWPRIKLNIQINPECPIFILEGAIELGQIDKKTYMEAVQNLISTCGKANNYIKFHPAQSSTIKKEYLQMFKNKGMNVEELPMNIPCEIILYSFKGLTVCGFGSSLLFYAKTFGQKVISHEKDLLKSARYRFHVKNVSLLN